MGRSFRILEAPTREAIQASLFTNTEANPKSVSLRVQNDDETKRSLAVLIIITALSRPDPNDPDVLHFDGLVLAGSDLEPQKISGVCCVKGGAPRPDEEKEMDRWRVFIETMTIRREAPVQEPAT